MILMQIVVLQKPTGASFSTTPQSNEWERRELIPSSNQKKKFNKS